jgi:hypothetical protein
MATKTMVTPTIPANTVKGMSEQERKDAANTLFENCQESMINGFSRWQDEKEYEDIKNYAVLFTSKITEIGGEFIKMTKRPFGFQYKLAGATYHVTINGRSYGYQRVA